jgi:hypothetical protein
MGFEAYNDGDFHFGTVSYWVDDFGRVVTIAWNYSHPDWW